MSQYPSLPPFPPPPPKYPQEPLPYGSPGGPAASPRPTLVTAVGILAIVFGGMGVSGGLCSLPQQFGVQFGPNPVQDAIRADRILFAWTVGSLCLNTIISMIQLAGGIGVLSLHAWARKSLIVYAWANLTTGIAGLVIGALYVRPRMTAITAQAMKALAKNSPLNLQFIMEVMQYAGYFMGGLALTWAMFVLYSMGRPHVKAAFEGPAMPPYRPEGV